MRLCCLLLAAQTLVPDAFPSQTSAFLHQSLVAKGAHSHFSHPTLPIFFACLVPSMPASEIDDIFASKGKAPPAVVPSSSSQPADAKKKKQKKAKKSSEQAQEQPPSSVSSTKRKRDDHESTTPKVEHTAKRRVPETVLDPSAQLAAPSKGKSKPETSNTSSRPRPSKKARPEKEDQERFKDSRGTGPSMSSLVNLSFFSCNSVASRAQNRGRLPHLQIRRTRHHRVGWRYAVRFAWESLIFIPIFTDTPQCPFDCQCCMSSPLLFRN